MSAPQLAPMPIDVVSDIVCPWCFIGKRRLEKAIALKPDQYNAIRSAAKASKQSLSEWIRNKLNANEKS